MYYFEVNPQHSHYYRRFCGLRPLKEFRLTGLCQWWPTGSLIRKNL
jgi:hypothetical protein